jgi:hypothetical protein
MRSSIVARIARAVLPNSDLLLGPVGVADGVVWADTWEIRSMGKLVTNWESEAACPRAACTRLAVR